APICFNAPAARSYLPITIAKTKLVLAGKSKTQMFDAIQAALDKKELPALEFGSMCYMMSKEGYLSDRDGHWHPHLMFFVPLTDAKVWGRRPAGLSDFCRRGYSRPIDRFSGSNLEVVRRHGGFR